MKLALFFIAVSFCGVLFTVNAHDPKIGQLKTLTAAHNGIIRLNYTGYKHFTSPDREYDLVIFLTAPNCRLCDDLYKEFQAAVRLYHEDGCMEFKQDGAITLGPVFFAAVEFQESNKEIFREIGARSAPDILIAKPHFQTLDQDAKKTYLKKYYWAVMPSDGHVTTVKLLEYINQKVQRNVVYRESVASLFVGIGIMGAILCTGLLLFLKYKEFFLNPKVWLFGSYAVMFICMSGVVYNIIHEVPLMRGDSWFAKRNRSQTALEGYIMSGTMLLVGILIASIQILGKFSETNNRFFTSVSMMFCIAGAFLLMTFAGNIYYAKTGFYNTRMFPPPHYIKGSYTRDQGLSI